MAEQKPLGFFAAWKATDTWYSASEDEKREFDRKVEDIFSRARDKGVKMHGVYDCCWSTEWKYFTFWEVPNLELLEEVMDELSEIGDINMYNAQRHFVGRKVKD